MAVSIPTKKQIDPLTQLTKNIMPGGGVIGTALNRATLSALPNVNNNAKTFFNNAMNPISNIIPGLNTITPAVNSMTNSNNAPTIPTIVPTATPAKAPSDLSNIQVKSKGGLVYTEGANVYEKLKDGSIYKNGTLVPAANYKYIPLDLLNADTSFVNKSVDWYNYNNPDYQREMRNSADSQLNTANNQTNIPNIATPTSDLGLLSQTATPTVGNQADIPTTDNFSNSTYNDQISQLIEMLKNKNNSPLQYDPTTDPALKVAQEQARLEADRNAARRGMLYSDSARSGESSALQASQKLIPQYQALAEQTRQQDINNLAQQLGLISDIRGQEFNQKLGEANYNLGKQGQLFNQSMDKSNYELNKQAQTFNQGMDTNKFNSDQVQRELDNKYKQGTLDYQRERDAIADSQYSQEYKLKLDEFAWTKSSNNPAVKAQILANQINDLELQEAKNPNSLTNKERIAKVQEAKTALAKVQYEFEILKKYGASEAELKLEQIRSSLKTEAAQRANIANEISNRNTNTAIAKSKTNTTATTNTTKDYTNNYNEAATYFSGVNPDTGKKWTNEEVAINLVNGEQDYKKQLSPNNFDKLLKNYQANYYNEILNNWNGHNKDLHNELERIPEYYKKALGSYYNELFSVKR